MKIHLHKLKGDQTANACQAAAIDYASRCTRCDVLQRSCQATFEKQQADNAPQTDEITILQYGSDLTDGDAQSLSSWLSHDTFTSSYTVLFPNDAVAFPPHPKEGTEGRIKSIDKAAHCYLVFFHIKEEHVDDFCKLLLHECEVVRANEPGMLRYDLYQHCSDPTKFIVYELARDEEAMKAHELRRADGKLRALLNPMQLVSRREIHGTGRYEHLFPSVSLAQWPIEWRYPAAVALSAIGGRTFPFGFKVSASGDADAAWLSEKCGKHAMSAHLRDLEKIGGMCADFFVLDVVWADDAEDGGTKRIRKRAALVLKTTCTTTTGLGSLDRAKVMGTAREGMFYAELATELTHAGVPKPWYAHGDLSSGEKLVLMELLPNAMPCGVFFGPSNPNNWAFRDKLAEMTAGGLTMNNVTTSAFDLYAKMHARYWRDQDILMKQWLRGADWMRGEGEESWLAAQKLASDAWAEQKVLLGKHTSPIKWHPHVVACLDKSFSLISWEHFQAHLASSVWTLVHGDCHPHNALLCNQGTDHATMALIDFEMVGIGSPVQELGQYLISHMPPDERRASERELVQGYHASLCANLRERGLDSEAAKFDFDMCWAEYVTGGAGRWLWFVPYLAKMCPPEMGQFFHDQLSSFLNDHIPNEDAVKMPRV